MPHKSPIYSLNNVGDFSSTVSLHDPKSMPNACGFLWNSKMVLQMNCRGYAVSQFMQPEPAKFSHAPNLEQKTFVQPEHSYFSHHPGRFFYIKDHDNNELFSVPYEPMRVPLDTFEFKLGSSEISWHIEHLGLKITITVSLATDDCVERWSLQVNNHSTKARRLSIYPYFSIGYMSWMNQSAQFEPHLNAIVASSVTPYQKVEQYFKNKELKDQTFFAAQQVPDSWHANQLEFEGHGGLHNPDALGDETLGNVDARFQTPVAVMQYRADLAPQQETNYRFLFGPAKDHDEIERLIADYLPDAPAIKAQQQYQDYIAQGRGCLTLDSDVPALNDFVNHWLPRQMFYHGGVNRLSSDPQTRNYIQDNMGMCYIQPSVARQAFILTLSQQQRDGSMPDGILLHDEAQLKYINQVPHSDHCVWLPICLAAYLAETDDVELMNLAIPFSDCATPQSFIKHIELALDWLLGARDERGLSYIEQGDWCDPMNMVGYKGLGVSAWLSLATAYAINTWCELCEQYQLAVAPATLAYYRQQAIDINTAVNQHLYVGKWFARGITDENRVFGTEADEQGKIFLNPQSWAMLSGAASEQQQESMLDEIKRQLMTPFGVMMIAPSYTSMVEDIGRVTQKHPGVSENGSVYNHAAIFYAYSLYQQGQADLAFEVIEKMMPSLEQCLQTGQLPVYVPNYYRGAYHQYPKQAGRSSHLFNTGTISWLYRCIVEELCGLKGNSAGLLVNPKLPSQLNRLGGQRRFKGAVIDFNIVRCNKVGSIETRLDHQLISDNQLVGLKAGTNYRLDVLVPHHG